MAGGMKKAAQAAGAEQIAKTWQGPKGICTCEHVGDGRWSQHAGTLMIIQNGHGACLEPGCSCTRFTFDRWTQAFKNILIEARAL